MGQMINRERDSEHRPYTIINGGSNRSFRARRSPLRSSRSRAYYYHVQVNGHRRRSLRGNPFANNFPDLAQLPPELSLAVLSHLDATDLCLAACIWDGLANDEVLWMRLCKTTWGSVTAYKHWMRQSEVSYKKLYMLLDEASVTFNADPDMGLDYLKEHELLDDNPIDIATFIHTTNRLWPAKKREFLDKRRDVLDHLVELQNFENLFLPNALRKFFAELCAPTERGNYLNEMIDKFSDRFCACNPRLGLSKDTIYVLCFSLIMLSVDLCSPHVKNKMSKREFIKNTKNAAQEVNDDLAGHLYDNIYLVGHVTGIRES